jgi:hypothetical protein
VAQSVRRRGARKAMSGHGEFVFTVIAKLARISSPHAALI